MFYTYIINVTKGVDFIMIIKENNELNCYEFIMYDDSGCLWNWEDDEDNVIIEASSADEAMQIFLDTVEYEYEDVAREYYPREIKDFDAYAENHYYTFW